MNRSAQYVPVRDAEIVQLWQRKYHGWYRLRNWLAGYNIR